MISTSEACRGHDALSAAQQAVEAIVRRVIEISTLPQTAVRVMAVARDPDSGAGDLKAAVESDPALGARVLRVINSSHAGLRTRVTNLQHAISLLGFNQVRNLALTASVGRLFACEAKVGTYCRAALWRHLVTVAIAARQVAQRCRLVDFEDAFLAGLLHDVGIVVADQHMHARFAEVVLGLRDGEPLSAAERRVLGFDHCQLGAQLARAWRFPEATASAIAHHHDSSACPAASRAIVSCVEVANVLCTLKGISSIGRNALAAPVAALETLGFAPADLVLLAGELDQELERNQKVFDL